MFEEEGRGSNIPRMIFIGCAEAVVFKKEGWIRYNLKIIFIVYVCPRCVPLDEISEGMVLASNESVVGIYRVFYQL